MLVLYSWRGKLSEHCCTSLLSPFLFSRVFPRRSGREVGGGGGRGEKERKKKGGGGRVSIFPISSSFNEVSVCSDV